MHTAVDQSRKTNTSADQLVMPPAATPAIKFVMHERFHDPDAWHTFVEAPYPARGPHKANIKVSLPSKAQDDYLFLKMNYLKYRAHQLNVQSEGTCSPVAQQEIQRHLEMASQAYGQILKNYEPLIRYSAEHFIHPQVSMETIMDAGREALVRKLHLFDITKSGNCKKFVFDILNQGIGNTAKRELAAKNRLKNLGIEFVNIPLKDLHAVIDPRPHSEFIDRHDKATTLEILRARVNALSEKERYVITKCFGLDGAPPQTLDEVGKTLPGVTRNRGAVSRQYVLQVRDRALAKVQRGVQHRMNTL